MHRFVKLHWIYSMFASCRHGYLVAGLCCGLASGCFGRGYDARLTETVGQARITGPFKAFLCSEASSERGVSIRLPKAFSGDSTVTAAGSELGPKGNGRLFRFSKQFPMRKNEWFGVVVSIEPGKGEKADFFTANFHRRLKEVWEYSGGESGVDVQIGTPDGGKISAKLFQGPAKIPQKVTEPEGQLMQGEIAAYLVPQGDKVLVVEWIGMIPLVEDEKFFDRAKVSMGTLVYDPAAAAAAAENAKAKAGGKAEPGKKK